MEYNDDVLHDMDDKEIDEFNETLHTIETMPIKPGVPEETGHWWHWDEYTFLREKNFCRYWEYLMWLLMKHGFPYDIEHAVRYTVLSQSSVRAEQYPWICDYPPRSWRGAEEIICLWLTDNPQFS